MIFILILLSSVRNGTAFCALTTLHSRGYGGPFKYQHIPEFKNVPTSGRKAVGKISQPSKAWQKPVKRHQVTPRGIKPTPQHLICGRNASPSKPTGVGTAQSPTDPQEDDWGKRCCRTGTVISNRINSGFWLLSKAVFVGKHQSQWNSRCPKMS